ncbi:DUF4188 domain-containing protein [Solwaraspora sp. WMMD1047]|uniref:DUF4188 domain-containing protein n=1 Tax=Solwaraspora sp. WMMD1047 TaxID=3016102 RepID=UPI002416D13A|nr:DUF4188 domain-containing protein [Solwaraspora sp. WMMD1047]MDG4829311.1 DUF4188 domain-containing protein [Solwaraspora sp. WMMD1047]
MRTTDFSATPPQGQATAMFVGATRYRGLRSIVTLMPRWFRMVRQMRRMSGYRWHTLYWQFPLTLGTIAFFSDRDAMLKFARSREHRELMCWLVDEGTNRATAGFIRLYTADEQGYANGVWRAEDSVLAHDERFAPLATETTGPPVHRR